MPKIFEYFGFIFLFYSNEHEPIHVHVMKDALTMVVSPLCSMFIFCAKAEVVADAINMRQAAFIILFVSIVKLLLIVIVYIY